MTLKEITKRRNSEMIRKRMALQRSLKVALTRSPKRTAPKRSLKMTQKENLKTSEKQFQDGSENTLRAIALKKILMRMAPTKSLIKMFSMKSQTPEKSEYEDDSS